MEWRDVANNVAKVAPALGALLGGPAGASVGALVSSVLGVESSPGAVSEAIAHPENVVKLRELETNRAIRFQELLAEQAKAELVAVTQNAGDINATMRAESASSHWPSYSWRPAIGFSVAIAVALSVITVFAAYIAAIFDNNEKGLTHLPAILAAVAGIIAVVSPILGIASWFRGRAQADPSNPIAKG